MLLNRILTGFFALLMLLLTATVLWGLNKGFDFTDEGLYILTLTEPSQSLPYFKYGFILKGLFGWLKPGIVFYRSLRLVLTLVLGLLLGNSFIAWALGKNHKWSALHWALVCFVTVSCFTSYSIFPQTPSYNNFVMFFGQMLMIALFYFLKYNKKNNSSRQLMSLSFAIGLLLMILVFTRISVGLVLVVLWFATLPLIGLYFNKNISSLLVNVGFSVLGMLLGWIYFASTYTGNDGIIASMQSASDAYYGHDFTVIYKTYTRSLRDTFVDGILKFIDVFVIILLLVFYREKISYKPLIFIVTVVFTASRMYFANLHLSGQVNCASAFHAYALLLALGIFVFFLCTTKSNLDFKKTVGHVGILVFLISLPFVLSLGSNNPIAIHGLLYVFSIALALVYLLVNISQSAHGVAILKGLLVVFSMVATSQSMYGFIKDPYRLNGGLQAQTVQYEIPGKRGTLYLNEPQVAALDSCKAVLTQAKVDLNANLPMIGLSKSPGLVYLLGGYVPGAPWYEFNQSKLNCYNIVLAKEADLTQLVILTEGDGRIPVDFIQCLNQRGIGFPDKYFNAGKLKHPYNGTDLHILVPR